MVGGG
jgi:hypothetical protein